MHLQPPIRALYYQYSFFTFSRQKNRSLFDQLRPPSEHLCQPPIRALYYQYIFSTYFPTKKSVAFRPAPTPSEHPCQPPYQGVILSIYFFHLFPDKKIGRFSTVFACPYFTVTARGCQSLVPCFSLISWSCTRILFFLSTTALGCAFNVLLHACTVAPNAVTAFIIRCHRSHVNPFTRPKNDFFV